MDAFPVERFAMKTYSRFLCAALVALFAVLDLRAQSASETLSYFGQLGQGNAGVTGSQDLKDNACVPTSVANGLTFLENYANFALDVPSPFTVSPNNYAAVNALVTAMNTDADGTAYSDKFNGLQEYLSDTGANPAPSVYIFGQASPASKGGVPVVNAGINLEGVNPTVNFLLVNLLNNNAIELGLQWGAWDGNTFKPDGGHSVTLDSLRYDAASKSGTLGIIDPWGANTVSNHANTSAGDFDVTFSIVNGFIYITYPLTVADNPADFDLGSDAPKEAGFVIGSGQTARVLNVVVEAVPDSGATALLLGCGLVALYLFRRKMA
jgi:hypothetical protein